MEHQTPDTDNTDMNIFRAPAAARAIKTLDRSLFSRKLPTTAACVSDNRLLSKYRKALERSRELFLLDRFSSIALHPDASLASNGQKCLILDPAFKPAAPESWSVDLQEGTKSGDLSLIPYEVQIDYDLWSYLDVIKSILPEELHGEIPVGFNTAGHIAHLNLRGPYLPYKHVIAQIILDKNPNIKTVINKTDNVGTENEFRTFSYELLAGEDDMTVELSKSGCVFKFDYSKVYWNTKLNTEHERITALFKKGEAVADVMAGIGPFAVPAGKKGVFVWANDKNPESYFYMEEAIKKNKVSGFVKSFNQDGHDFIRNAADSVLAASKRGDFALGQAPKVSRNSKEPPKPRPRYPVPRTISHFVMNLPASAIEFLHNFKGLYEGHEELFAPHTDAQLPTIHVHCFAVKADDDTAYNDICKRIRDEIGVMLRPGDAGKDGEVAIHEVRDVAPAKRMFCASFRLPSEVAFASRS